MNTTHHHFLLPLQLERAAYLATSTATTIAETTSRGEKAVRSNDEDDNPRGGRIRAHPQIVAVSQVHEISYCCS